MAPTLVAPPAIVDPPARISRRYGLFSILDWREGDRFETGVTWTSLPCIPAFGRSGASCTVPRPRSRAARRCLRHDRRHA